MWCQGDLYFFPSTVVKKISHNQLKNQLFFFTFGHSNHPNFLKKSHNSGPIPVLRKRTHIWFIYSRNNKHYHNLSFFLKNLLKQQKTLLKPSCFLTLPSVSVWKNEGKERAGEWWQKFGCTAGKLWDSLQSLNHFGAETGRSAEVANFCYLASLTHKWELQENTKVWNHKSGAGWGWWKDEPRKVLGGLGKGDSRPPDSNL